MQGEVKGAWGIKPMRRFLWKFELFSLLIFSFSLFNIGQTAVTNVKSPTVVPDQIMEQVVRRVLVWSFKPRSKPTVVYVFNEDLNQSWLPVIRNVEFRLLSIEEIQHRQLKVYFFTEPEQSGNSYSISFAFGTPPFGTSHCNYQGENWRFRISEKTLRLWHKGFVVGGCDSVAQSEQNKQNRAVGPAIHLK